MHTSQPTEQSVDFDFFLNYPEENNIQSNNMDSQTPADGSFNPSFVLPDMDLSQFDASLDMSDSFGYSTSSVNESPSTSDYDLFAPQADDFRPLVESWALADQSSRSMKQKRIDAAIDLHLHRFATLHSDFQLFPTDSEYSFSDSPSTSHSQESPLESPATSTPASSTSNIQPVGGRELVFDINLNTATNLPKKQKKRTQAQINDYINARRNGACLKHKKQHKKCNCHEKQAAKVAQDAKKRRKAVLSKVTAVPAPGLVKTAPSETPSTMSQSSFTLPVFPQMDGQQSNDEIDAPWTSFDDLYGTGQWFSFEDHSPMVHVPQDYLQTQSHGWSPLGYSDFNAAEVSMNLRADVGYLPVQDKSFSAVQSTTSPELPSELFAPKSYPQTESYGSSDVRRSDANTQEVPNMGLQTHLGYLPQRDEPSNQLLGLREDIRHRGSRNAQGLTTGGQPGLPNTQGQAISQTLQALPMARSLVPPDTRSWTLSTTPAAVQPVSRAQLGITESNMAVHPEALKQSSEPVRKMLPTTSSLVSSAASLNRPILQGSTLETVMPVSNVWLRGSPGQSSLSSSVVSMASRLPVVAHSLGALALSRWLQETSPSSLSYFAPTTSPELQTVFTKVQGSTPHLALFKDVPQYAHLAVQTFLGISAAIWSVVYWMSELCAAVLPSMLQVAVLFQSNLHHSAEKYRQRNPVSRSCSSILSTPMTISHSLALHV